MVKIENWVVFPERFTLPLEYSEDLYTVYKQSPPNLDLIDDSMKKKLGPYILMGEVDYQEIKKNNIILYISVSPKLREGWSVEYGLFRAALEIAEEESTGTWDPDLHTIKPEEMDDNSKANMEILRAKVIGMNINTGLISVAYPKEGFEYGNLPQLLSTLDRRHPGL